MPKLSKRKHVQLTIRNGSDVLVDRQLAVRDQVDVEIALLNALREHRLKSFDNGILWDARITLKPVVDSPVSLPAE